MPRPEFPYIGVRFVIYMGNAIKLYYRFEVFLNLTTLPGLMARRFVDPGWDKKRVIESLKFS